MLATYPTYCSDGTTPYSDSCSGTKVSHDRGHQAPVLIAVLGHRGRQRLVQLRHVLARHARQVSQRAHLEKKEKGKNGIEREGRGGEMRENVVVL